MSRKTDLEGHVRESYTLIREYQGIEQLSDDPREKRRAQRAIGEQWTLIKTYLEEYLPLCQRMNLPIPTDVQEIAAFFPAYAERLQASPPSSGAQASGSASEPDLVTLHTVLTQSFDLEELRTLCFELGVAYDDLRREGRTAKARELLKLCQRKEQLDRLVVRVRQARPGSL